MFFRSLHRTALCAVPLLVFAAAQTRAQNAALQDSLPQAVIQTNRAGSRSPVPHVNLSAEQIARIYTAQDIPYLLGATPSVVETSDAGAGVGYTGMRIRGADPTRVNVTINGVPLNDAESQGVFWVNLPDLASSASEIQVQRGVGSSTNGAGAFGATVNIDLSRVNPEPYAAVENAVGSFNTRRHSLQTGTGLIGGRWTFSGRLSTIQSDGYIDRARSDLRSWHASGAYIGERHSIQAHILSGAEKTYQAWYGVPAQYADDPALRTFNPAGAERPGAPYDNEVDDYFQRHHLLHYRLRATPALTLQLNGHYTRGYGFFEQYKAAQAFADYGLPDWQGGDTTLRTTDLVRRRWLDNHFYGATFALIWTPPVNPPFLAKSPQFTLGGALSRYEGQHFGDVIWAGYAIPQNWIYYDNDALKDDANLYLKSEFFFSNGLSAMLDLQGRRVTYRFEGFDSELANVTQTDALVFFNPKAGLHWENRQGTAAYLFGGIANREPNRNDYVESTPASRPKPERLYNIEMGYRQKKQTWEIGANGFWMYYRDQLALDGRLNDVGAYTRTNIPHSYRAGIELDARWTPDARYGLQGSAALSRNRIRQFASFVDNWETGEQESFLLRNTPLAFSPDLIAFAAADARLWKRGDKEARVTLAGKRVGRQYLDNTGSASAALPGYFTADLRINFDFAAGRHSRMSLLLICHNLFDARFANNGWTYRFRSPNYDPRTDDPYAVADRSDLYRLTGLFPQAGRHYMVALRWRLGQ